jgi:hypothetical protein
MKNLPMKGGKEGHSQLVRHPHRFGKMSGGLLARRKERALLVGRDRDMLTVLFSTMPQNAGHRAYDALPQKTPVLLLNLRLG